MTVVGDAVFYEKSNMKYLEILSSVTVIEYEAFRYWGKDQTIYIETTSKPNGWQDRWCDRCNVRILWCDEWKYVNGVPTVK